MRKNVLYIASPSHVHHIKSELHALQRKQLYIHTEAESFLIVDKETVGFEIQLHLLQKLSEITSHLQQFPVDLLVYDERNGGLDAVKAMDQIREQMEALASQWGPDFHFPMGRIIAILGNAPHAADRSFMLGRDGLKDIMVNPKQLIKVIHWITELLQADHEQNEAEIGVALSGGGLEGFLYQLGCGHALEKALTQRSLYDSKIFSGVSSGSILAATYATKIPIKEIVASFYGKSQILPQMRSRTIYEIAGKEIIGRVTAQSTQWAGLDPNKWMQKFLRSIPTGLFKGDGIHNYIRQAIETFNGKDTFESLTNELYIGATTQDTFEPVIFGKPPWEHVKVSDAVRASCALPPVFTPIELDGQNFIDGQIAQSCNLELLVKKGCNLIFIIDPLKPYVPMGQGSVDKLGGLFTLVQTIKTLVYTRFRAELAHVTERYPDVDFIVFQPYDESAKVMSGSPMKYRINTQIMELAYVETLKRLRERHHVYSHKLSKYGFQLIAPHKLLEAERNGIEV